MNARAAWVAVSLACGGCGGAAAPARPVQLPALALPHVPTAAERKATVCARSNLEPVAPPIVTTAANPALRGLVRSVSVRDAAGREVTVPSESTHPVERDREIERSELDEATRRLWRTGRFDDVSVETAAAKDGVGVVFRVVLKRTIGDVFIASDAGAADATRLHLASGEPYDPAALWGARRNLRAYYVDEGYRDATVAVSSAFAGSDARAVDVCVRVEHGPRVVIDAIGTRGSAFGAELDGALQREDTVNVIGRPVDADHLERDALVLQAMLFDKGLLESKVERTLERHGDRIAVVFAVTDGPVFRYSAIDVRGALVLPKAKYMKLVPMRRGDVFNRTALMKLEQDIAALHAAAGRADLDVEPTTQLDTVKHTVSVVFQVTGPAGFSVVELHRGSGRPAKKGDTVDVTYTGKFPNGTVFDTNVGKSPFTFELGGGTVIRGFERGVTGMKVGGRRRVTIPPDLGYGARGVPPKIPPKSTLVFDIEVTAIR